MNVLIVGSGGREHSLAWALSRSPSKPGIFGLPGNPGIAELGENLPTDMLDPSTVLQAVRETRIDLVVVGPEAPLVDGLADALNQAGVRVFGPSAAAAEIEGSKVFAKDLMERYGIPTAGHQVAYDADAANRIAAGVGYPHVLKADGLAAGKGALIVQSRAEAEEAIDAMMVKKQFGDAGARVVFEEFLEGEEMSVFAVASGERYVLLTTSQDYKRAHDGDRGLNTGGMGAYAPVVTWNDTLAEHVCTEIIEPTLLAMAREDRPYTGLLYAGLMVREKKARVVEFNCRFGDPETQALVPIIDGDLLELLWEASDPAIGKRPLPECAHDGRTAVCVVLSSGGYPGKVTTGHTIHGIEKAREVSGALVFHAGTGMDKSNLVTRGGRVLNVVGVDRTLPAAQECAYVAASKIEFEGVFCRRDIGWRGLEALSARSNSES
ncbi:phosphoribosylamine--glycine ligase [Candidatus Eisenbacteria bacterium]|uniref:Phosphoribosylamine--glycine ligase n=1 Tax=Eiseniibacteriota bacterium TaxID=2212470 RepID=A0ABV6YJA9_UNCEI